MSTTTTPPEKVFFSTEDGYTLTGLRYANPSATANILIASATGVPQGFYRRFAEYAVAKGFQVLSFDYRGVGLSAPPTLKHFKMSYLDWGRYDLTAAIDYLSLDNKPIYLIGHSYGGQALGLTRNHQQVKAMYCYGTGAGWHGYMPLTERIRIQGVWNIIFPPLVALYGYLPWSKLNMGADLPFDVYAQWRKWCKNPRYFFDDADFNYLHEVYASIKTPIYAVAALDDAWALPASRHAFMQHYTQADLHYIDIEPQTYGMAEIGHMGYFKKGAERIWDQVLNHFIALNQK